MPRPRRGGRVRGDKGAGPGVFTRVRNRIRKARTVSQQTRSKAARIASESASLASDKPREELRSSRDAGAALGPRSQAHAVPHVQAAFRGMIARAGESATKGTITRSEWDSSAVNAAALGPSATQLLQSSLQLHTDSHDVPAVGSLVMVACLLHQQAPQTRTALCAPRLVADVASVSLAPALPHPCVCCVRSQ